MEIFLFAVADQAVCRMSPTSPLAVLVASVRLMSVPLMSGYAA